MKAARKHLSYPNSSTGNLNGVKPTQTTKKLFAKTRKSLWVRYFPDHFRPVVEIPDLFPLTLHSKMPAEISPSASYSMELVILT
jgi:hypothetical protein